LSKSVIEAWQTESGAIVSGRRTFDMAGGWKEGHPIDVPIFVLTHDPPTHGEWSPRVTFVPEGLQRAVDLAQEAAGVLAVGRMRRRPGPTAAPVRHARRDRAQCLPHLLGGGIRLFDNLGPDSLRLEQASVIESTGVTHIRYRVLHA